MNPSIRAKLDQLVERQEEINRLLIDPSTISDQNLFRSLSIELAEIEPVVTQYRLQQATCDELEAAKSMLEDSDSELRELAQQEVKSLENKLSQQDQEIQKLLIPKIPMTGVIFF